ncbi:MAG TPA: tartrate dehydrogenase, partial [Chloroflexota bacterium]|nr:tartrate dehydrogenase [Chloroflexota bacterium]
MREYSIACIPGDGIGHEVIAAGRKVLDAAQETDGGFRLEYAEFPWSCEYYTRHGEMMPKDGLKQLEDHQAVYLGAVGFPSVPDHISLWGLLLPIRQGFQQYVNYRPVQLLPGVPCPLRDKGPEDVDFVCLRENTEGEYAGVGGRVHRGSEDEVAIQTGVFTRKGVERVVRYGFEIAMGRPRKELVSATKSNACQYSMVFWDEVVRDVAREYPEVKVSQMHVDALAAQFVLRPETLSVVVASNLFGDILTDLGGALQGSLGIPASANLNPERRYPSMFEPVHGSAPDIAGQGIANPIAAIWAGASMLEFLGEKEAAGRVMDAVRAVTGEGRLFT